MTAIGMTCGDPAGIGPEIIETWARRHPESASRVCLAGPCSWIESLASAHLFASVEAVGPATYTRVPGAPSVNGARAAFEALEWAAAGCAEGRFGAVVTGPVSKRWMNEAGFDYPGQTEFFASRWGGEPTMAFCGGKLRVVLATWHVPLAEVPKRITPSCVERAVRRAPVLADLCGIEGPRIAVCGLNPHAGEDGMIGTEEKTIINPLLDRLRGEIPGLSGALPGDTVFQRALAGEFDVVVALYHDQGLAPLKSVDFNEAANVTLGLAHLRTSPDHGTAYEIAGTGRADIGSFTRAVELALAAVGS